MHVTPYLATPLCRVLIRPRMWPPVFFVCPPIALQRQKITNSGTWISV